MLEIMSYFHNLTDIQIIGIFIGCMIVLYGVIFLATGSWRLGILAAETINIYNLTIYLTPWLGLGIKPFLPLWMTLIILVFPFIMVGLEPLLFKSNNIDKENTKEH